MCAEGRGRCVRRYSLAVILAAGLLVLAGLGLFVGGLATGTTDYYWTCVGCCALAAVLLVVVRLRPGSRVAPSAQEPPRARAAAPARAPGTTTVGSSRTATGAGTATAEPTGGTPEEAAEGVASGRHSAGATAAPAASAAAVPDPAATDEDRPEAASTDTDSAPGQPAPGEPAPVEVPEPAAVRQRATTGRHDGDDPAEEVAEVTDLLMVVDMVDQVLVVDEHPRYHLATCAWLRGRATIPLPVTEARSDGFTPCAVCAPDSHLADLARARKAAAKK